MWLWVGKDLDSNPGSSFLRSRFLTEKVGGSPAALWVGMRFSEILMAQPPLTASLSALVPLPKGDFNAQEYDEHQVVLRGGRRNPVCSTLTKHF